MTSDTKAPERIWASYIRTQDGMWIGKHAAQDAPYKGATAYIRHDLHLSRIKDIYEDAQSGIQAALEAHDKWIREETLMGAAAYVRAAFVGCDRVADAIETLIEKEQTDE